MRRGSALVVSAALHVGAVAALAGLLEASTPPATQASDASNALDAPTIDGFALTLPPADVVAVDVVTLPAPSPRGQGRIGGVAAPGRPRSSPSPETGAIAVSPGRAGELPGPPGTAPGPPAPRMPDISSIIVGLAGSAAVETVVRSGKLHETGGGAARIDDAVTTVTVDRDGTAHFHDKPDLDIHLLPTLPALGDLRKDLGAMLGDWYKDPYRDVNNTGRAQDLPEIALAEPGEADNYGLTPPSGGPSDGPSGGTIPLVGGSFDLTAFAMKKILGKAAGDPYKERKLALLNQTREERAQRGAVYRSEQLDRSAELVRKNLEALWMSTVDPTQRKEALFELWDECDEGEGASGEAGQRARGQVVGWIRAKLPAGSPAAFTADEIARLSARRTSKQTFAPYEDD